MRGEVHILLYCPIDTLQWGQTHSAMCPPVTVVRICFSPVVHSFPPPTVVCLCEHFFSGFCLFSLSDLLDIVKSDLPVNTIYSTYMQMYVDVHKTTGQFWGYFPSSLRFMYNGTCASEIIN